MNAHDTILLATRNQGKIRELTKMLAPFRLTVLGLESFPDLREVEETGSSFEENALLKARYASENSGLAAVADDSGICVDTLGGAPGIYSARFSLLDDGENGQPPVLGKDTSGLCPSWPGGSAGAQPPVLTLDERNNRKLLKLLAGVPGGKRGARFCSAIAAVAPGGEVLTALGFWEGVISAFPKGENGFGYDPIFLDPETGLTAAELSPHEKNRRSHRARAMQVLAERWPEFWAKCSG